MLPSATCFQGEEEIIMRNTEILALTVLITSLAIAPAYAKRHAWDNPSQHVGKKYGQTERLKRQLDLTAQQQTELKAIRTESRERTASLREEAAENRVAIRDLLDAEDLDEPRLRELTREQAERHADQMVAKHGMRANVNQILSPEQQKKFEELRRQRAEEKRPRRSAGAENEKTGR